MNTIFKTFTGISIALVIMFTLTSQAYAFTDYGTNDANAQCFDEDCDIVYSVDYSCSISNNEANNITYNRSCKLFSARFSSMEKEREANRARIRLQLLGK